MDSVEKNMIIGAFATSAVDMGLEANFTYNRGAGRRLDGQFPYIGIHDAIPPLDDWIANAGIPALFYLLGKVTKKQALIEMAKGGAIYGVSQLAGLTLYRVANLATPPAAARYVIVGNRRM